MSALKQNTPDNLDITAAWRRGDAGLLRPTRWTAVRYAAALATWLKSRQGASS